jgi:long-chain fatty acid transport protein
MSGNLSALYYNPAALSLGSGTRLMIDGTLAYRSVDYTRPEGAVQHPMNAGGDSLALNSGTAELRNFAGSPFIAVGSDLGIPKLNVALGLFAPFGGGASWSERSGVSEAQTSAYPGVQDGTQRWWSIDSSLKVLYVSLGASYEVHPTLSVGLAANLVMSSIDTVRARNTDGSDDLTFDITGEQRLLEGRSYLNASGRDVSVGAGVLWSPTQTVRVGYSYQSQPGFGDAEPMEGELWSVVRDGSAPTNSQPIDFHQELPDIHRLGVSWRASERVELRLFGDYVRWSVFQDQCVASKPKPNEPDAGRSTICTVNDLGVALENSDATLNIKRNWVDAWGMRAGASYWLTPGVELYAGAGYDGNAASDEGTDPSLFDMNKYSAALGARLSFLEDRLALAFTYTQVFYETRELGVTLNDAGEPSNPFTGASNGPSAAGTYEQSIGVGNLNMEYHF